MKRKLVIVTSAAMFEESSDDVEQFRRHQAWTDLFQSMGGLDRADAEYHLSELCSAATWERFVAPVDGISETSIRVYSGYVRSD